MAAGLELHEAAATGDLDSLEEYLKSGKIDVNLKDEEWNNKTALHWASAKGYVECIRLLLDFGADGSAKSDTGWTAAHFAAETGKLTVLRALYNADVPIGKKDKYGDTPRRVAEIYGHSDCMKFLETAEVQQKENSQRHIVSRLRRKRSPNPLAKRCISVNPGSPGLAPGTSGSAFSSALSAFTSRIKSAPPQLNSRSAEEEQQNKQLNDSNEVGSDNERES